MAARRTFWQWGTALLIMTLAIEASHAQSDTAETQAQVVRVVSGDTVRLLVPAESDEEPTDIQIHLSEIDAPADDQPFADEAVKLTESLLPEGTIVTLTILPANPEDSKKAVPQAHIVLSDKTDVAMELLREGLAWWAWKDADRTPEERSRTLADLERQARLSRLGVFSSDNPIVPENYRLGARTGGGQTIFEVDVAGKPTEVLRTSDCVIIALMPNPRGTDDGHESVTVANRSLKPIQLEGWTLHDDDGGNFALSGQLDAGLALTIVLDDSLQLGNNGDTVWLSTPQNKPAHAVSYSSSRSGQFVAVQ